MKQFFFIIVFFISAADLFGQSRQTENVYFYNILSNRLNNSFQNITFLEGDTINTDVSKLDFSYTNKIGAFHKSQEPYKTNLTTLYTEGIYTFDKIKIAGSFLVDKQWDDSLKNNLNGTFDDATPYYYFATKAGKYQRQNYKFTGLASYTLSKFVYAGLGIDYNYHWTTGSVDPRPEDKIFNYILSPQVSFKHKKLLFGFKGIWGKGTENSNITYKNSNYGNSLSYADRIFYMNHGYGYITVKDQSIYQHRRSYTGFGINFQNALNDWILLSSFNYLKRREGNTKEVYAATNLDYYSKWNLETWDIKFFAEKQTKNSLNQWSIDVTNQTGRDWDSIFNANNYQYEHQKAKLKYSYLNLKKSGIQLGWDAGVNYEHVDKKDMIQAHHIDYSIIEPSIALNLYKHLNNKNSISFSLNPTMVFPINNKINVPITQINVFTKNIVYPDFYYWSSQVFKLSLGGNWRTKSLLNKKECGFFTNIDFANQLKTSSVAYDAATLPGKTRWNSQIGFRIYL